jgi:PKD repeat protein
VQVAARGGCARVAVVACALVGLLALAGDSLSATGDVGYEDQSFSGTSTPTGTKRAESVLWWNDGSWWANMWDSRSADFHIFRLDTGTQTWVDTGVTTDPRANAHADVLWDGTHLYVASHLFVNDEVAAAPGYPSYVYRFSYDRASRTYSLDAGFPAQINNMKTETLVIDKDSTGKLWATWQQGNRIYLNRTLNGDDRTWGTPFAFSSADANVTVDDNSAVVAFAGSKLGIMWSNQSSTNDAMFFAIHQDGDPDTAWGPSERALQGPSSADDHMSLKSLQSDGSGRIFAGVKTSYTTSTAPLIMLLVRSSNGAWSNAPIARVSDCPNRPMVLIDEENKVLHTFYTAPAPPSYSCTSSGGAIYEKTSPLENPSFTTGRGTPVIVDADSAFVHNVTSTKQNVNNTGIAVLAANGNTGRYWHAYETIPPASSSGPPTAAFTATPTSGTVPLAVAFTDTSTGRPTSWSWDFGDGATLTAQSPSHTYTTAGTYTVSLTVANSTGSDTLTKTNYITATAPPPPTADFTASPTSGPAPLSVGFADLSTGSPTSWSWSFGDGATSTAQSPSHTYTTAGTYMVSLTVTNASGTSTATKTDYITATPPRPDFGVSVSPAKQVIVRGATASYTVTIEPVNGFGAPVALSVSGLPSGVTGTFNPNPVDVPTSKSSTLVVTTTSAMKVGSHTLTIQATSETLVHKATATLQVKRQ